MKSKPISIRYDPDKINTIQEVSGLKTIQQVFDFVVDMYLLVLEKRRPQELIQSQQNHQAPLRPQEATERKFSEVWVNGPEVKDLTKPPANKFVEKLKEDTDLAGLLS